MAGTGTPRWLRSIAAEGRSRLELAAGALKTLLDAALDSGARVRTTAAYDIAVHPANMEHLLGGLWRRLKVPEAVVVAGSGSDFARAARECTGNRTLEADWVERLQSCSRSRRSWLHLFAAHAIWTHDAGGTQPTCGPGAWCLEDALERLVDGLGPRALVRSGAFPLSAAYDPTLAIRLSHAQLLDRHARGSLVDLDLDALAIIGAATRAIALTRRCRLCWRWSMPGHELCHAHSLSIEAGGSGSERQARYQRALRMERYLHMLEGAPRLRWIDSTQGKRNPLQDDVRYLLRRVLWRTPVPGEDRKVRQLLELVSSLPAVASMLPIQLTPASLIDNLQKYLDPLEVRVGRWPAKLRVAQLWAEAEAIAAPGRRGLGRRSMEYLLAGTSPYPGAQRRWMRRFDALPEPNRIRSVRDAQHCPTSLRSESGESPVLG